MHYIKNRDYSISEIEAITEDYPINAIYSTKDYTYVSNEEFTIKSGPYSTLYPVYDGLPESSNREDQMWDKGSILIDLEFIDGKKLKSSLFSAYLVYSTRNYEKEFTLKLNGIINE
jgi:hypothetical protein